jgi:hypothetical protein
MTREAVVIVDLSSPLDRRIEAGRLQQSKINHKVMCGQTPQDTWRSDSI